MEKFNEWPRVHTCLYDWCPQESEECRRCDAIVKILSNTKDKNNEQVEKPTIR